MPCLLVHHQLYNLSRLPGTVPLDTRIRQIRETLIEGKMTTTSSAATRHSIPPSRVANAFAGNCNLPAVDSTAFFAEFSKHCFEKFPQFLSHILCRRLDHS